MSPVIIYRFEDEDGYGPFTGKVALETDFFINLDMVSMPSPRADGMRFGAGYSFGFAGDHSLSKVSPYDVKLMSKHGYYLSTYMVMPPCVLWGESQVAFLKGEAIQIEIGD